jgi:phosphocarrier protein HPr
VEANGRLRQTVLIANPQGLHMRPAAAFAGAAARFASVVTVWNGPKSANGKSLMDLLTLAAECGTELIIEIAGNDAHDALRPLVEILAAPSADDFE